MYLFPDSKKLIGQDMVIRNKFSHFAKLFNCALFIIEFLFNIFGNIIL